MKTDFLKDLKDFSNELAKEDNILVVSHHDADGICSCGIALDLLHYLKKNVNFLVMKQLDSNTVKKIKDFSYDVILFTDFGSGQLSLIERNNLGKYYIIDHHVPEDKYDLQINPHFYGYDGGLDISGGGMTYLVAKSLKRDSMAHIAVVSAIGDMQDNGGELHSLNRNILEDAVSQNTIKVKRDLSIFGRQSRPISQMLAYSSEPVIPGLTGNPDKCSEFIHNLGIPLKDDGKWRHYVDLSWEDRKKLTTALYIYLLNLNTPEFIIQRLIGEVYTLLKEEKKTELRDAKEYSTMLNACGRQDKPEIGVKICLGERGETLHTARRILEKHRQMLKEGLNYLTSKGTKEMEYLYYFDSDGKIKESIIGVITGMAYGAQIIPPNKPILAFAIDKDDENLLKVSSRANWNLVRKGIHLGKAMHEGCKIIGGEGGGHNIAAGARIPKDKKEEFLEIVNKIFKDQRKVNF